uniref:SRS domain-containing protein n=1 Tax=Sarcocystis aucheniae TaxID=65407 RepID=A0A5P9S511_9APIC|nr:hypothetical protein [Sarcocystis aucheniae]
MKLFMVAALATLTVVVALVSASLAGENGKTVDCDGKEALQPPAKITAAPATVEVTCGEQASIKPDFSGDKLENVFQTQECRDQVPLSQICSTATAQKAADGKAVKISISELPATPQNFFIQCLGTAGNGKKCIAQVSLSGTGLANGQEQEDTEGPSGQGNTDVQTCSPVNTSITLRIADKGASAKFSCEKSFTLYPSAADKVFAENCRTEENLKDMTRSESQTVFTEAQTVFTLTAKEKPQKKKLCYLCAKAGVSELQPGSSTDYCKVYVEASARSQFGYRFTFALLLPSVLSALHSA